ncbi:MAG: NAD-dependent epimerase/dehydratase family protein [Myxococcota bacterium]|nr:NAD-dependent epimerase/dehydratase family protein [Myxococcota bacterium]
MKALMIGGTGPTGPYVVNGLIERGFQVEMLHSGRNEIPEIPDEVVHIHTDAYDPDKFAAAIEGRTYDVCVASYGRLRKIAEILKGRVGRFVSVGGLPALRGYMNPFAFEPNGMPVPTPADGPLVLDEVIDTKGFRIVLTEQALLEHQPEASHFRYPYVYGPRQPVPREWMIVRRILDKRPHLILPDGGLTLHHFGYAENLAHALLLAIDRPENCKGQIYNAGDAEVLTLRKVVETVAGGLGHDWELINMPWHLAMPARPLITQPLTTHRVMDVSKMQQDFGYVDLVAPEEALVRTAKWLVENPLSDKQASLLEDPFDYAAEDELIAWWRGATAEPPKIAWTREPGYGSAYSGPGGRARSKAKYE